MRTLLLERACLLIFCTLLIVTNLREHREMRGLRWFAASNVGYLFGGLLIAGRGHLPAWASVILANFLYSMGYVLLHRCLVAFFGRRRRLWLLQCLAATLSLTQCIFFTEIHPDIRLRLAAIGLATGMQFAVCAAVAFHGIRTPMRSAAIGMGSVLTFSAALNFIRIALTLIWGRTQSYLQADAIQTITVMLNTTVFVAIDIAFVWMIATALRQELQLQAMTDPLTQVLNRRALESMTGYVIHKSRTSGQPLSAIVIDLDSFKDINDSLGHSAGDRTLVWVAACLKSGLRESDLLARIGGDEFVIVLPNCPQEQAREVAERLRSAMEQLIVPVDAHEVRVHASFGVASMKESMTGWENLLAECDRALYNAKSVGGNLVQLT